MFSGIIEEVGTIVELKDSADGRALRIGVERVTEDCVDGASISVNGACLTVIQFDSQSFLVEATHETLRRTTLGRLIMGAKVNLERALKVSDRLGGHLVSGHIDAVGNVERITEDGFSRVITFAIDSKFSPLFVDKGSVAVEGVSLTVVEPEVRGQKLHFKVALIPHTMEVTTLGTLKIGEGVNVETDMIARYVARLTLPYVSEKLNKDVTTLPFALDQS